MVTASPIEPSGSLGPAGSAPPSAHGSPALLTKTKAAIETLQEELAVSKKDNDRLRRDSAAKAMQLRDLQTQSEAQAARLAALDGRLAQGQTALTNACTNAKTKETEIAALKEAITSREAIIRDQAATVARLDRMAAEGEAAAALARDRAAVVEQDRAALAAAVQELKRGEVAAATSAAAASQALQEQLQRARAELQNEQSARETAQRRQEAALAGLESQLRHRETELEAALRQATAVAADLEGTKRQATAACSEFEERLRRREEELEAARRQGAAAAAEGAAEATSLRSLTEQLARERRDWEAERMRLVKESQRRLEEAERWLERAAADAEAQKRASADQAAQQLNLLNADWMRRAEEAITAARQDERARVRAEQDAAAAQRAQEQAQCAHYHVEMAHAEAAIDARVREVMAAQQGAWAEELDAVQAQVERCVEALVDRMARHQDKVEKRQSKMKRYLRLLAAETGCSRPHHVVHSPYYGAMAAAALWDCED